MKKFITALSLIIIGTILSFSFFEKSLHVKPVDNQPNWYLWLYLLGMGLMMGRVIVGVKGLFGYLSQKTTFPFYQSLTYFALGGVTFAATYNGLMQVELLNFLIDPYFLLFLFSLAILAWALILLINELFDYYKKR
ncbi:hypothetical protein [Vagococcus bubulae]|uniref:Uncharacterized protein n=1 Tax=Vagococcus bubulae TaxID=1977868 RepID=A0A429ZRK1_9ENTE|nr:hypothetical protein [Vagococcus bubulae]RST96269.1 hypothetical protein CBF36_00630 [Vagococcus bubulae]